MARYGGEEFVVLIPESDEDGAMTHAKRLCETVAQQRFEDEAGNLIAGVTISVGVASFPQHASDASTMIDRADRALYQAKRGGRNTIRSASDPEKEEELAPA